MRNCLVAQSGGPTAVINATLAGIIKANQLNPYYDCVYGGLYGIEGILAEKIVDIGDLSEEDNLLLRQTPASSLGSCRYKLKRERKEDFAKLFSIFQKYDIETLFYIGGNDSMDTVAALTEYAQEEGIVGHRFIGCPKTVDNDLCITDHCPGFGSAAKFIASVVSQTWLDLNVYTRQEVFILETMGRDAGWLSASACVSGKVDLLVLPEQTFDEERFLAKVKSYISQKNKCYIVISEGCKYADGTYLAAKNTKNDGFGHAILGGAGEVLKNMLLSSGITQRCKVQDLATLQRSFAPMQSLVDVTEAFQLGMSAHARSVDGIFSGRMVAIVREQSKEYKVKYIDVAVSEVANKVKKFPQEWILEDYQGITPDAISYLKPLMKGTPILIYHEGLPAYLPPFYLREDK